VVSGDDAATSADAMALDGSVDSGDGGPPVDSALAADAEAAATAQSDAGADDSHNCGACEHDCLGAACSGGICAATVLATDDTNVF
jgi:hypothetical protein